MRSAFICACWMIMVLIPCVAQEYFDRDSLWQELKKTGADTNRVWLYIQLGQQYESNDPDSALMLYESALKLSTELGYVRGMISYYTNATYVYNQKGRFDTSLILNLRSVDLARAFGDPERIAACLGNTGASYMVLERYEEAIDYHLQIVPIYESLGKKMELATVYDNIGVVYYELNQYAKSIEYGQRALSLGREIDNVFRITSALINLGTVYTKSGDVHKAIEMLREAQDLAIKTDNQYALVMTLVNLGDCYIILSDWPKVKTYSEQAVVLARKMEDRLSEIIALRALAIYYFTKEQLKLAEQYARESLQLAFEISADKQIGLAYSVLSEIAILKKDFKESAYYSQKSDSISTLLLNESLARNIQNVEARYESEKKEQQISQLRQQAEIKDLSISQGRLINYILVGSLVSLLVITVLARRNYQQKKVLFEKEHIVQEAKIARLESEKQRMAGEAVIRGQEEERGRIARDLHDGLGGLLSGVKFSLSNIKSDAVLSADNVLMFERSMDMLDHSISELRRVAHNMMPEVLVRFGLPEALKSYCDNLRKSQVFKIDCHCIEMNERLAGNTEIFIFRIIQELLTNIARHAKATHVLVQLARHGNELNITVEDNGVGFESSKKIESAGAGWINIRSRVEYLKGKVDIQSNPGIGTSIHITIPLT